MDSKKHFILISKRYGITGYIIGGKLKTKKDKESLRAKWISIDKINEYVKKGKLRGNDMIELINRYRNSKPLTILSE